MANIGVAFHWQRDTKGYRLVPNERDGPDLIVRLGGPLETYQPLKIAGLYAIFARVTGAESLLGFISKYGPLSEVGNSEIVPDKPKRRTSFGLEVEIKQTQAGQNVGEALVQASWFRKVLSLPRNSDQQKRHIAAPKPLKLAQARLVSDKAGYKIEYRPRSLLDGMRLQLALHLLGHREVKYCAYCNEPFEVGVGTGKRLDARFCSPEHRIRFNSQKRTKS